MKSSTKKILFWTPRILCILFAVFISLFALDVFDGKHSIWEMIGGFLIHLIPTYIILIVLALSWRWEWIGGVVYIGLGLLYMVMSWGQFHWTVYLSISAPLFLIGALFIVNWLYRAEIHTRS